MMMEEIYDVVRMFKNDEKEGAVKKTEVLIKSFPTISIPITLGSSFD